MNNTLLRFLEDLYKRDYADSISLYYSMKDVHHQGLFSLVLKGEEFGKLTRVFMAEEDILPYSVQLHTHRYPITLVSIQGQIRQHEAYQSGKRQAISIPKYDYYSPVIGGNGLSYRGDISVELKEYNIPIGSSISMFVEEFHTISCTKGSIWIVREEGYLEDKSEVLGVPFKTDGLYNPATKNEIEIQLDLFKASIKPLIEALKNC